MCLIHLSWLRLMASVVDRRPTIALILCPWLFFALLCTSDGVGVFWSFLGVALLHLQVDFDSMIWYY
jgi:hypothetical protein